jgi:hypothetical protein
MKSAIAIILIPAVHAGTNKTLAPTPGVRRPTPMPSDSNESLQPTIVDIFPTPVPVTTDIFPTPVPVTTDIFPTPVPVTTDIFPTPVPDTPAPTPPPESTPYMSMSIDYVIDGFSSSKSGKSSGSTGEYSWITLFSFT